MAHAFPHPVGGRIDDATKALLDQALSDGLATEGAIVRRALEDFLPRYLAGQTKGHNAELLKKLGELLTRRPSLVHELQAMLVAAQRPARRVRA